MQFFQNIKNLVSSSISRVFNYLSNWFYNEPIQTNDEDVPAEERHFPLISPSLIGLSAMCMAALPKRNLELQETCSIKGPFFKKDDDCAPGGASFTCATPPNPQDYNAHVYAASCA